jgi:hypothetical protein
MLEKLTADILRMEALGDVLPHLDQPLLSVDEANRASHIGFRWPTVFNAANPDNNESTMAELWNNRLPFIVKNAMPTVTPQAFLAGTNRDQSCTVSFLDSGKWVDAKSTLQDYFDLWATGSDQVLQVQVCIILYYNLGLSVIQVQPGLSPKWQS